MEVCIFFLCAMIFLPGIAASVHPVKAFLHHTVHLSCYFPNSQKIDMTNLIIFWQKDTKVLHEVYYGQEKRENLSPEYINRTKVDMGKWTLQLLNAGVEDEGRYQCIVMQKKTEQPAQVIHRSECSLLIIANYSQPEIAELHSGEPKPNGYLNLTCSSSGGYPEPKEMTWLISHDNITHSSTAHMDVSQDAVTKLYNVTSKLNIPVPTRSPTNISCLLRLREQLGSLVSVPLGIGLLNTIKIQSRSLLIFVQLCTLLIGLAMVILAIMLFPLQFFSPLWLYENRYLTNCDEIQEKEMEQAKINFFGPLIAVIVLTISALLLGFVILKKKRNILSTNQSVSLAV